MDIILNLVQMEEKQLVIFHLENLFFFSINNLN